MQEYTPNKSHWTNKKNFIILHHCWTKHFKGVVNYFKNINSRVSAHYVVGMEWELAKFNTDDDILRHCGVSSYRGINWLNEYSIWIEVCNDWERFTDIQKKEVRKLIAKLMQEHWIWKENVIRHKDIAPWRKVDIYDSFRNNEYATFEDYQNSFTSIEPMQKTYTITEDDKTVDLQTVILLNSALHKKLYFTKKLIWWKELKNQMQKVQKDLSKLNNMLRERGY